MYIQLNYFPIHLKNKSVNQLYFNLKKKKKKERKKKRTQ